MASQTTIEAERFLDRLKAVRSRFNCTATKFQGLSFQAPPVSVQKVVGSRQKKYTHSCISPF